MPKKIIISVTNDLSIDQRIHRIASTLHEAGYEVLVVGRRLRRSRPLQQRAYKTHRLGLWFQKGKLFYMEYAFRLFWFLLFRKFDLLNSNDLDTLLPNFLVAKIKRKRLIYDSHEYFTETPELVTRPGTRKIWLRLERWLFPRLKMAYTVNQSIADIYHGKYKVPVRVIHNYPFAKGRPGPDPKREKILIYQGAMNMGRGLELMIAAMTYLPGYQLWIIGLGNVEEKLLALAKELNLGERIMFWGFKPFEELEAYTRQAMLGLSLEEDLGENFRLALPNKMFDYIQAGVPVLVSDLPEMRKVVVKYEVGGILESANRTPEGLASVIRGICEKTGQWGIYVRNTEAAARELCWEKEREKLVEMYSEFIQGGGGSSPLSSEPQ